MDKLLQSSTDLKHGGRYVRLSIPCTLKVWWADGRVTETSGTNTLDVFERTVEGACHPYEKWELWQN